MKKINLIIAVTVALILSSCSSTKIISSWKDPNTKVHANQWKKILVVALLKNETSRRKAEDEMVKQLGQKGTTSYSYLGDENYTKTNEEELRKRMKNDGFDAAITMRLVDVDKEKIYTPAQHHLYPVYYNSFSRYYQRSWYFYTTPGYYTVTKKFIIETVIYSIEEDKIIWSGITETYNPENVEKLTNEIATVIHDKMITEGFIN
jgi:hypothetical protein